MVVFQHITSHTWVECKNFFCHAWLTLAFEAELLAKWNRLGLKEGEDLETYNQGFCDAGLPISFINQSLS